MFGRVLNTLMRRTEKITHTEKLLHPLFLNLGPLLNLYIFQSLLKRRPFKKFRSSFNKVVGQTICMWDVLRYLVPFLQFKNLKNSIPPWEFFMFLNCANGVNHAKQQVSFNSKQFFIKASCSLKNCLQTRFLCLNSFASFVMLWKVISKKFIRHL